MKISWNSHENRRFQATRRAGRGRAAQLAQLAQRRNLVRVFAKSTELRPFAMYINGYKMVIK